MNNKDSKDASLQQDADTVADAFEKLAKAFKDLFQPAIDAIAKAFNELQAIYWQREYGKLLRAREEIRNRRRCFKRRL